MRIQVTHAQALASTPENHPPRPNPINNPLVGEHYSESQHSAIRVAFDLEPVEEAARHA